MKLKKILAVILSFTLVLALTACQKNDDVDTDESLASADSTSSSATEANNCGIFFLHKLEIYSML